MSEVYIPRWQREFEIFYQLKPVLLLEGNISDLFQYPEDRSVLTLPVYLERLLKDKGYVNVISFQNVNGFFSTGGDEEELEAFARFSGSEKEIRNGCIEVPFAMGEDGDATGMIRRGMMQREAATAVILEFSSRYVTAPDSLEQAEVDSFTQLLIAARDAARAQNSKGGYSRNLIIGLVNKANDLPAWFCLDNPYVGILHLSTPDMKERMELVAGDRFHFFFDKDIYQQEIGYYEEHKSELARLKDRFVGLTEGFTFLELNDVRKLCRNEKYHIAQLTDVIDLYRYGIRENPWTSDELNTNLADGTERLKRRVKGQDAAIGHTMDVVKRAATGLSGLQHSSHTKPKGILFFAGPTGTGKTETAKAMAEMIFGEESRCIRFDMSEYASPNSDQRLLGAPPGYVGYQAGGQLTNAVRENPFSILLFDEIEKAHSSIFDKFLQILEDGRMTDGQGRTVYFSETIIIFTSNLGIYRMDEYGKRVLNVSPDEKYEDVEKKVRTAIEQFFKVELGRPEILNRIGENIVVFDFIRKEAARAILEAQVEKIIVNMKQEKNIVLEISDTAMDKLFEKAGGNLANGGRGIGNVVEEILINPLARYLFDNNCRKDVMIEIKDIDITVNPVAMDIVHSGLPERK